MRGDYQNNAKNPWPKILLALIGIIFVILIARFIGKEDVQDIQTAPISLRLTEATSNAQITTGDNDQKNVNSNTPLTALDLVEIRNGTGQIVFLSNAKNTLNLNNGTKIRYVGQNAGSKTEFRVESKDIWITADTADMTFDLIGTNLVPASNSIINVSKNELFTTITVFQGSATINLGGGTLEISAGKQLNYSSLKALTIDELGSRVVNINPETLATDWMKLNNAAGYLSTSPSTTTSDTPSNTNTGLILFESPIDESTVSTKSITLSGKILSPTVSRVIINNTPAIVDPTKQSFTLSNVTLTNKENNFVYRTYDVAGSVLSKWIITVYTTAPGVSTSPTSPSGRAAVETYKPDSRFRVIAPSTDFYETRETKVKIEGRVTPNVAHHITINDFRLNSFSPNGTSWYYFANQQFWNMQEWVNTYTIRYFDANGEELYKQLFVIKKLSAVTARPRTASSEITLGE